MRTPASIVGRYAEQVADEYARKVAAVHRGHCIHCGHRWMSVVELKRCPRCNVAQFDALTDYVYDRGMFAPLTED